LETFEQPAITSTVLGDMVYYLMPNMQVKLTFYEGEALDVELPTSVDLEVIEAEMAVRGDTATGVTKKVKVETGLEVQVPGFVNTGDRIRIDTRNGSYLTRV
jgi:elongation factor P